MPRLSGYQLRVFRTAKRLRLFDLYYWYRLRICRDLAHLPWFDPFDATHLMVALAPAIARNPNSHLEWTQADFLQNLPQEIRDDPEFDGTKDFRRMLRTINREWQDRGKLAYGPEGLKWTCRSGKGDKLIIDVYWRRATSPRLSIGQRIHLERLIDRTPAITPTVIADVWKETLSQDWPIPAELAPAFQARSEVCAVRLDSGCRAPREDR